MIFCPKCGVEYSGAEKFCPKDGTRLSTGTGEKKLPRVPSIPPDRDPLINRVIQGRYKVLSQIGEGGMGVVYLAEHVEIEKMVALKVLRDDFSKRPELLARFKQEARSASRIGNQHIVDVTDFGQLDDGGVFFVMEYLQGKGLSEVIQNEVISLERTLSIVLQIARALNAAHKLGIVHRDLKPENVYLVENDESKDFVKILDFGIAKISDTDTEGQRLTKTGMIFGTPEYMSPEQASGRPLDHRVDIYALGCIMFEMFTGQVPFDGESFMAVLTQHMFEPVPPIEEVNPEADVPEAIKAVVYKAMAKDTEDRYGSMTELADDLERCIEDSDYIPTYSRYDFRIPDLDKTGRLRGNGRPGKTTMDWSPESGVFHRRRGRIGLVVGLGLLVFLLGGAGAAYWRGYLPFLEDNVLKAEGRLTVTAQNTLKPGDEPSTTDGTASENPSGKERATSPTADTGAEEASTAKDSAGEIKEKGPEEPSRITVSINTKPKGAVVMIEGMGQVCSITPCEVELPEGTPVEVEATLDNKTKRRTFTPSPQNRELFLTLKKSRSGFHRGGKKPETKASGTRETATGLKIPKIFENQ
jgi:eukaryotic-like serine/threonine-protein kinase